MSIEQVFVPTADNYSLSATLYKPDGVRNDKCILICSGVGIARQFYQKFALYFRDQGYTVVTFDYRGIGASDDSYKNKQVSKHNWGINDINCILQWIKDSFQPKKLFVIGHSAGGTLIGLAPNHRYVDAMVTVGTQSGYWQNWSGPRKYLYATLWYFFMPILTYTLGYFPSKRLGLGENLPKRVALEWSMWCRHPDYLFCEDTKNRISSFKAFTAPILGYSFSDDNSAPKKAVNWLLAQYSSVCVLHKHLSPSQLNSNSIGHFGLFKEKFKDSLWQEILTWLDTH